MCIKKESNITAHCNIKRNLRHEMNDILELTPIFTLSTLFILFQCIQKGNGKQDKKKKDQERPELPGHPQFSASFESSKFEPKEQKQKPDHDDNKDKDKDVNTKENHGQNGDSHEHSSKNNENHGKGESDNNGKGPSDNQGNGKGPNDNNGVGKGASENNGVGKGASPKGSDDNLGRKSPAGSEGKGRKGT